jgi:hypothetical protein
LFKYDASAHDVVEVSSDDYSLLLGGEPAVAVGCVADRERHHLARVAAVPSTSSAVCWGTIPPGRCTTTLPAAAPHSAPSGGITIYSGGPLTVIMTLCSVLRLQRNAGVLS